jgi:hypothetical protein
MPDSTLESVLLELENFERKYFDLGKLMFEPGRVYLYSMDILASAIMDRSLSLIYGFTSLIRANNFTCAAPLVRMHLDNVLRLYAAYISDDCQNFAMKVFEGVHIRNLKDRDGFKMTDKYLIDKLSKDYQWMTEVYAKTSGYIHLSNTHIFNSSRINGSKERAIAFTISREDRWLTEESKLEATNCMLEISQILFDYLSGWNDTKRQVGFKSK